MAKGFRIHPVHSKRRLELCNACCASSSTRPGHEGKSRQGLATNFPPSNLNTHKQVELKSVEEDPFQLCNTSSSEANKWTIFRVPYQLRRVNENAYEPNLVSIGPYHHGKKHLKAMEEVKKSFFNSMINETRKKPSEFVSAMQDMKNIARECYSDLEPLDPKSKNSDMGSFVKMMILDGCFIVQLFRRKHSRSSECFLALNGVNPEIYYDLLLLENQLPFKVLSKLYGMIEGVDDETNEFARLALEELAYLKPGDKNPDKWSGEAPDSIKHLLGLVYYSWCPQNGGTEDGTQERGLEKEKKTEFISCARELEEAGIKFEKKEYNDVKDENGTNKKVSLFDIEFKDGKLMIPTLNIEEQTEIIFRNLVAYEQFNLISEPTYICDYVMFMDNLINSSKDVQLLRRSKVIISWLGDDKAVAKMFNKMHDFTYSNSSSFYYAQIYGEVHKHCGRQSNEWKAKLKKEYFHYPWSILSVLAAAALLLLTVQQSIFSILSYGHHR